MDADSLLQTGTGSITVAAATSATLDVVESTGNGTITVTAAGGSITEAANPGQIGAVGSTSILDLTATGRSEPPVWVRWTRMSAFSAYRPEGW